MLRRFAAVLQMPCLVPVRRFLSPSRPIHSGDALAARGTRQADAYFPFANGRFHFIVHATTGNQPLIMIDLICSLE